MTSVNGKAPVPEELLDEAVVAYLEAVERGETPDLEEWQARYPEVASELIDFFADHASVNRLTAPLRKAASPVRHRVEDPNSTVVYRPSPLLPTKIGNSGDYLLLEEIDRGGMGVVYLARQVSLNRTVAVKMILSGYMASQTEIRRFHDEAIAAAHLDHPNIVPIYEVGEFEGQPFYSMKAMEGGSLANHLKRMRDRPRDTAGLIAKVAQAVHHAHQSGILHRDLMPGNVLLDRAGEPFVSDFGLSKRLEHGTHSGVVVGTPGYSAPEQAAGTERPTTAADLYSLGAVLYAGLTGRPPFEGENRLEIMRQVAEEAPVRPRTLNPLVEGDLETICLKCLEKSPRDSYPSVWAFAEDLQRYLAGEPIQARQTPIWVRGLKWAKRRPALAVLQLVTLTTILGMIAGSFRYQAQRASAAEQALNEGRRIASLREKIQALIQQGKESISAAQWSDARFYLATARGLLCAEPALGDLQEPIDDLLKHADRGHAQKLARRHAASKHRMFMDLRGDALFTETSLTGSNFPVHGKKFRQQVREALQLFYVTEESSGRLVFPPYLTAEERNEITEGCYELFLILAESLAQNDPPRWEESFRILERASALGLVSKAHHLQRARYLERLGDQTGATSARRQAASLHAGGALDHFLMGEELHRQGKMIDAIGAFRNALRLQPNHFWSRYFLAICYLRVQPSRPDLAIDALTACLGQGRNVAWVYLFRGLAHTQLNLVGPAEEDLQIAMNQKPNADARYAVLVNRGVLLGRQKKLSGAVRDLNEAIAIKPKSYQAFVNLASVYQQQQDLAAAIEQMDQALANGDMLFRTGELGRPVLASLYRTRAVIRMERKECRAALEDYRQAIQLNPRAEDHVACGRILHGLRSFQEALCAYDKALAENPDHREALLCRAETLCKLANWREVVLTLDRYLTGNAAAAGAQTLAEVYRARGLAQVKLGNWADAISDFTMALSHRDDSLTHVQRGWSYLASRAPHLALPDFEKALQLDRNNGDAYNGRGAVRVALAVKRSQLREGIADVELALSHGPRNDARLLCNVARTYAQAAIKMEGERGSLGSRMSGKYREQVIQLLREALELTPPAERASFSRNTIQADGVLSGFAATLKLE
jgi:tetratricopeptide (TPR) repeat protein